MNLWAGPFVLQSGLHVASRTAIETIARRHICLFGTLHRPGRVASTLWNDGILPRWDVWQWRQQTTTVPMRGMHRTAQACSDVSCHGWCAHDISLAPPLPLIPWPGLVVGGSGSTRFSTHVAYGEPGSRLWPALPACLPQEDGPADQSPIVGGGVAGEQQTAESLRRAMGKSNEGDVTRPCYARHNRLWGFWDNGIGTGRRTLREVCGGRLR